VCECAAVSVPDVAGDTVMVWPGSPETDTDQSTVPPQALRYTSAPRPPGTRESEPPPGNTHSLPEGWLGEADGEVEAVGDGLVVAADGELLAPAVVGAVVGAGIVLAVGVPVGVVVRSACDRLADAAGVLARAAAAPVVAAGGPAAAGDVGSATGDSCR
jgi:hypothetical protein